MFFFGGFFIANPSCRPSTGRWPRRSGRSTPRPCRASSSPTSSRTRAAWAGSSTRSQRPGRQCCGTGTGTVTCSKVGTETGTVFSYGSGNAARYKIMYVFDFLHLTFFFHSHFTINLKRQDYLQNFFFLISFLW